MSKKLFTGIARQKMLLLRRPASPKSFLRDLWAVSFTVID